MFVLLISCRQPMPIPMRRVALLLLCTLAACSRTDRPLSSRESPPTVAARDTADVERPLWQFGESTTRTDSLPADADSLREWGEYNEGEAPVAYAVDLNADGRPEWLVRSAKSLCGQFGGCPVKLLTRDSSGRLVDVLDGLAREVMVTNRTVNGWPVLWIYLGGIDGGVFRMTWREGQYEMAGTLLARRDMTEWSAKDYEANSVWRRIERVPTP